MSLKNILIDGITTPTPINEKYINYSMQIGKLLKERGEFTVVGFKKIDVLRFSSDLEGLLKTANVPDSLLPITLAVSNVKRLSRYGDKNITIRLINDNDVGLFNKIMADL